MGAKLLLAALLLLSALNVGKDKQPLLIDGPASAPAEFPLLTPVPQHRLEGERQWTQFPHVKQVLCSGTRGTAFRVGEHMLISAAHVTNGISCTIESNIVQATPEPDLDIAVIAYPIRKLGGFKISCDGFKPGQYYHAVGFARGAPWQQTVTVLATSMQDKAGYRIMLGYPTFIPGMSGGPVMDSAGVVVGIVNMYSPFKPYSWSRELKDTSLCRAS